MQRSNSTQVAGVELKRLRQTCNKFQQQQQQQHHHPQPQHQPQQQPQQQAQAPGDANKINQSRYWNDDEHERFLEAIQKYGHKDVKAIAAMVGTRNPTQVPLKHSVTRLRISCSVLFGLMRPCTCL